ncbi:MAG: wax ester/triacylglycerol synthase family O-acyltransferase [Actinomycetota bacterium]
MQQLTGVDSGFLSMETRHQFGHVSSVTVFDPGDRSGGAGFEATRQLILDRLHLLEPFRRRLVEVPFGLDHPYWIEDPDFDVDFHVRHIAVPAPGEREQLAELVARLIARPLDRSRPLWEYYVIEGLQGGRIAHLNKIHHATIDGASGAQMLAKLLDLDPDHQPGGPPPELPPAEEEPTPGELLARTAASLIAQPRKAIGLQVRALRSVADTTRTQGPAGLADLLARGLPGPLGEPLRRQRTEALREREERDGIIAPVVPAFTAPSTPWNHPISTHRRFAYDTLSLSAAKAVKNALGVTLNDVVMAITAGALRTYLLKHDALPEEPLITMVPVSVRSADEADTYSNRVSGILAPLGTHLDDPIERVRSVHEAMAGAKETHDAVPAELLQDFSQFATPALSTLANRLAIRARLTERVNPVNLVISNVPGPREPLYSSGARLEHFYPVSTIVDGQGLNVTVQSYLDNLDFGLVADRELVPDLWWMMDLFREELDVLHHATGTA